MHTDPELLSLLALGEDAGTENDRVHARTCPECVGELSLLDRLVALGRRVSAETRLATPSPAVWVRIRDELALGSGLGPPTRRPTFLAAHNPAPSTAAAADDVTATQSANRRVWRSPPSIITAAITRSADRFDKEPAARAQLTSVGASWFHAFGSAEVATDEHGRRLLQVALQANLPASGVRQAWLVHRSNPKLRQSVGILDGPHGLWTVDHSIDLEQYTILDISQQDAGETEHSGRTIVRGELSLVG